VAYLGSSEADNSVLGVDEHVYRCDECWASWVREKGGQRYEVLDEGDSYQEVIAPGAFDNAPDQVPLTYNFGPRIGTAHINKDKP
jgi:hypothetical protein